MSFVSTEKTTSNEYLSIDSKKSFNEKTVLFREQQETKNFCTNVEIIGLKLIFFLWTARNAIKWYRLEPSEYHHRADESPAPSYNPAQ